MKIKRFFARDMRTALAQVKDTLGSDAVIMSNKKVAGGIEIVAAVDYDDPKPRQSPAAPATMGMNEDTVSLGKSNVVKTRSNAPAQAQKVPADSLQALLERQQQRLSEQSRQPEPEPELPAWARGLTEAAQPQSQQQSRPEQRRAQAPSQAQMQDVAPGVAELREEMSALRALLTHQVSSLMTEQRERHDPVGAMLQQRLRQADFSPELAAKLSALSQHYEPAELVKTLPQSLANMLDNRGDDIVKQGGVIAFVGPTGVGKTTTLAKIAARFAAYHGADQVALITTDHYRIGAYEQLATYGKIMGCPVKQAHDFNELEQVLYQFRNRKLVLIDTAGMGQRDMRLYQQLDNLAANKRLPIRSYLVMSATAQRKVMQDAVKHFKRIPLSGAILTKLDESVSLAGALSVLIQNALPLSYVTDGQRVPEDLSVADTLALAKQALAVLEQRDDEEFMPQSGRSEEMTYAFE
ncbi:flagellar biosynthesis protein FlhF [Shewanella submarina]|uniref:Flagellar biosynthesis protein FlhF n=1 Tax=Shewanella submarina TaxID=2016376 RepID=A0ABV7GH32_9GAMM|nr:flagellar biosynthesis protein FlhF [Shewanella submarina]